MKLVMVGTGYVGLVSGACFAEFGFETVCVDKDKSRIEKIEKGNCPFLNQAWMTCLSSIHRKQNCSHLQLH